MELQLCQFNANTLAFFWNGIAVEGQKEKIIAMEWQEENGDNLEPHELFNQLNMVFKTPNI